MSTKPPPSAVTHVYGARFPDDLVEIIGNQEGLEQLINILIDAVSIGRGEATIATSDGFESEIRATCLRGARRAEEWSRSGSPYWDIDDPLVAQILDLTEENRRLRQTIAALKSEGRPIQRVEYHSGVTDNE